MTDDEAITAALLDLDDDQPGRGWTLKEIDDHLRAQGVTVDPKTYSRALTGSASVVTRKDEVTGESMQRGGMWVWLPVLTKKQQQEMQRV